MKTAPIEALNPPADGYRKPIKGLIRLQNRKSESARSFNLPVHNKPNFSRALPAAFNHEIG
jgi:hypothetical protein